MIWMTRFQGGPRLGHSFASSAADNFEWEALGREALGREVLGREVLVCGDCAGAG